VKFREGHGSYWSSRILQRRVCVCRYIRDGRDKAMEECEEKLTSLTSQLESKAKDKKELVEKIATLNKELANVKVWQAPPVT